MSERYSRRHGWALAKVVVRKGLGDRLVGEDDAAIGWVRFLATGLHNRVHATRCRLQSEEGEEEIEVVVRLPRADAPSGWATKARYHVRSDVPVTATEVHLQELCLVAGFVQQEIDERGADHPHVTTTRQWLRGLLRRAEAASGR